MINIIFYNFFENMLYKMSSLGTCSYNTKNYYLPKISQDGSLTFHPYNQGDNLEQNKYGIFEPISESINPQLLDTIIIPALMCDLAGYRLGYGKGYYDIFFKNSSFKGNKLIFIPEELLVKKYGEAEANKRIYATTDLVKGALRTQANELGYVTFNVPDDIGGRYSVFTGVGLLPIACAGVDIDELMNGAALAQKDCYELPFEQNEAMKYAVVRNKMYCDNKTTEILVSFEPKLSFISEWWKQLFGESEGKDGKGLFPASLVYSTDLHSLGQYVQEGKRLMFETVINVVNPEEVVTIEEAESDLDGINYLAGTSLDFVNKKAMQGTILAHVDGGVPNGVINLDKIDAKHIGYLLYFFMFSCGLSCYMLDINPFNQPGVESYKKNMFALLGKKGFEELKKELEKRL